jgi:hypothetical protein
MFLWLSSSATGLWLLGITLNDACMARRNVKQRRFVMTIFSKLALTLMLAVPAVCSAGCNDDYLKLSDFEGRYVGWGNSVGGYSGTCPGTSQANVFQYEMDKHGCGVVNFMSYTTFGCTESCPADVPGGSTVGSTQVEPDGEQTFKADPFTFKVKIFDASQGSYTVEVLNFPAPGIILVQDAVAIVKNGKVQETWSTYPGGKIAFGDSSTESNFGAVFGTTNTSVAFSKRQ